MLFKLKVIRADGGKITYWNATIRYIASILSQLLLFTGYLLIFWDKRKQALHDKIAKTLVIVEAPVVDVSKIRKEND